ncbi:MAG: ABC transporter substrate-binding protein [Caldilineaceae bacterium]
MLEQRCTTLRWLTVLFVVALVFAACAPIAPATPTTANSESSTTGNLAGFPLTIENCGRTLTISKPPERVLTTWQAPPELLVKLGLGDKIVGTENALQFPPPADIAEAYAKVPVLAKQAASKEAIIAAKPDFIISSFLAWDFDPKADRPTLDELSALGVQVFGLRDNCTADSHVTSVEMYEDMITIGRIFGVEERAQTLVDQMKAQIADVEKKVAGKTVVKVFFDAGGEGPVGTAGAGLQNEQINIAGGVNVFADHANYYEEVSLEEVAARQPEIFVVDTWDDPTYINGRSEWLIKTFSETPVKQRQTLCRNPRHLHLLWRHSLCRRH